MKNIFSKIVFFLLISFSVFGMAPETRAASAGKLGILPAFPDPERELTKSWFLYGVGRGEGKKDAVKIINSGDATKIVKVYAVDAVNTREGSFALLDESSPRNGIGKWVKLASETLEVPAKSAKLDPFEINVPENAEAGDHLGGIVVEEVDPKNNLSGTGVNIVSRVGVRIYETVPGEIKKDFTIDNFSRRQGPKEGRNWLRDILGFGKRSVFEADITNTGNVRLSPEAKIEVKNIFGRKIADLKDEKHGVVFPKSSETEIMFWEKMPLAGRCQAILTISALAPDGSRLDPKTKEISFWIFPWQFILVILAFALVSAALFFLRKYLQKILWRNLPIRTVSGSESLREIGKEFAVSWQKIAAINNLKKPYSLKKGDKLRIPIFPKGSSRIHMSPEGWQKLKKAILARRMIVAALVLAVCAGAVIFWQASKKIGAGPPRQKNRVSENSEAAKGESDQLTKTGAPKRSAVSVSVLAPSGSDPVSSQRLVRKLELVGYKLEPVLARRSEYTLTTIEYGAGGKEMAEMLKADLGVSDPVNLVEKENLEKDAVIWNFLPKNAFLEI
ncbi:MAG: hypothetical protein UX02_C0007G0029 [Candidatus Moranbacteria bacterium GW2011_GWC1_45_18]|nr:MAG: hypothetical protein UT79_C0006G0030 [Candidatus Moranbacteria bacterium GW2011_GWC2_40_12]KKT33164.1 MAG: hypothetical protein UW19_C0011G0028 [Candidatus Moranbacteria bacterium GW2011_GWF2_44_10]KKT99079.1 MAG: hypothetical protein UX02_C0007G0029 [Candidatus Moranbacteria bacterium GW2011_GWC1_45_18]OGI41806.1 MAG: hypothetical protein A2593_03895 [Candidatus Moranbacteria bacterium RIFOXYD1_FULL_44_9]HBB36497.1 hypothetical protein [Candidatus Moranbacteria bacterium]